MRTVVGPAIIDYLTQAGRQADRQANRQAGRHAGRLAGRHAGRQGGSGQVGRQVEDR